MRVMGKAQSKGPIARAVVGAAGTASLAGILTALSPVAARAAGVVPGVVYTANYGGAGASGVLATGSVTSYRAGDSGDAHALSTISAKINAPQGLIFDSSGDLWVTNSNTNTVTEYPRSQLAKASPRPSVTISSNTSGSLNGPGSLVFDPSGDLWVANTSVTTVVEFTRDQLSKSGAPTPKVTISDANFNAPYGVAIDSSGDLWVSDNAQQGSPAVFEYTKSELTKTSPVPNRTLSLPVGPIGDDTRSGLGFDSAGNLWVVNSSGDSLVEFSKSQLTKAAPVSTVTISSASNSLNSPDDLTFDSSGDVWVANTGDNTLVEYTKGQLAKSGSPMPARTIVGPGTGLDFPMAIAVEPARPR